MLSDLATSKDEHWGKSAGGGGRVLSGVGPFSTTKAVANPTGKCKSM